VQTNAQINHHRASTAICILLAAGDATGIVLAQDGEIVSSYRPTNPDVTFDQTKRKLHISE
jgi:hypothetical protein